VLLCRNTGKVISKTVILEKVWELSFDTGTNTIEVYISFLRNKIDKPFESKLIHTKPGFGYYVREAPLS
jgi:two-component system, OmpR family, copper resistance phosphate regulon response regulator CusR